MERWMIISWQHSDLADASYGQLIDTVMGTEAEAKERALEYVHNCGPIGIVREIIPIKKPCTCATTNINSFCDGCLEHIEDNLS